TNIIMFPFFCRCAHKPNLHLFPTRRSSDLLEDNPTDAELIRLTLARVQPDAKITPARNRREYITALRDKSFEGGDVLPPVPRRGDRKSTRLNSSHVANPYAGLLLKKKKGPP